MKYITGGNKSVTLKWKKDFIPEVCTSLVEVYDPATDTWSLGPELANALCGAGMCDILLLSHISILLLLVANLCHRMLLNRVNFCFIFSGFLHCI